MSFNGPLQPTKTLCQQDFILGAGAGSQNFTPQTSKIDEVKDIKLSVVSAFKNAAKYYISCHQLQK